MIAINGQLQCKLCKIPVKDSNSFIVHSKSNVHLKMIQKLKQAKMKQQSAKICFITWGRFYIL